MKYNHTPGYLPLQQDPPCLHHYSYLINLIPFEIDRTYTSFCDTTILTYEIELPHDVQEIGLNLLYDEYFTTPYVIDTIPNSPAGNQLPTQSNKMCGSFISIEKRPSNIKVWLMNSSATIIDVKNTRSILVYAKRRATRGKIL